MCSGDKRLYRSQDDPAFVQSGPPGGEVTEPDSDELEPGALVGGELGGLAHKAFAIAAKTAVIGSLPPPYCRGQAAGARSLSSRTPSATWYCISRPTRTGHDHDTHHRSEQGPRLRDRSSADRRRPSGLDRG